MLLLQCKLSGKAQEACLALTLEQNLEYEVVKGTVLCAYEHVPEAYIRVHKTVLKQTAKSMLSTHQSTLFENWCSVSGMCIFVELKMLILLEEVCTNTKHCRQSWVM